MIKTMDTTFTKSTKKTEGNAVDLIQTLKAAPTSHPALNRLRAKLIVNGETEVAITRYDRMYHRHNRS